MLTFTNGIWNELSEVIWPSTRCHLSARASHMCTGKTSGFMPLLLGLTVLLASWLTLTSVGAELWCHLANKHKYNIAGRHVFFLQQCGHLHEVDGIDNQTVNRVASNNQLIMNCKWGQGIDQPLAFGMCGEKGAGRLGCQCRWFIKQLAFVRGGLWLWACQLLLLSAVALRLNAKPLSPIQKGKGVGGGEANYWTGCLDSVA